MVITDLSKKVIGINLKVVSQNEFSFRIYFVQKIDIKITTLDIFEIRYITWQRILLYRKTI